MSCATFGHQPSSMPFAIYHLFGVVLSVPLFYDVDVNIYNQTYLSLSETMWGGYWGHMQLPRPTSSSTTSSKSSPSSFLSLKLKLLSNSKLPWLKICSNRLPNPHSIHHHSCDHLPHPSFFTCNATLFWLFPCTVATNQILFDHNF